MAPGDIRSIPALWLCRTPVSPACCRAPEGTRSESAGVLAKKPGLQRPGAPAFSLHPSGAVSRRCHLAAAVAARNEHPRRWRKAFCSGWMLFGDTRDFVSGD